MVFTEDLSEKDTNSPLDDFSMKGDGIDTIDASGGHRYSPYFADEELTFDVPPKRSRHVTFSRSPESEDGFIFEMENSDAQTEKCELIQLIVEEGCIPKGHYAPDRPDDREIDLAVDSVDFSESKESRSHSRPRRRRKRVGSGGMPVSSSLYPRPVSTILSSGDLSRSHTVGDLAKQGFDVNGDRSKVVKISVKPEILRSLSSGILMMQGRGKYAKRGLSGSGASQSDIQSDASGITSQSSLGTDGFLFFDDDETTDSYSIAASSSLWFIQAQLEERTPESPKKQTVVPVSPKPTNERKAHKTSQTPERKARPAPPKEAKTYKSFIRRTNVDHSRPIERHPVANSETNRVRYPCCAPILDGKSGEKSKRCQIKAKHGERGIDGLHLVENGVLTIWALGKTYGSEELSGSLTPARPMKQREWTAVGAGSDPRRRRQDVRGSSVTPVRDRDKSIWLETKIRVVRKRGVMKK
jgi:hypothetical protein